MRIIDFFVILTLSLCLWVLTLFLYTIISHFINFIKNKYGEAVIMQMFQTILGIFHIAFGIYLINPSEDSIFRGHPLTIILIVLTFILGIGRLRLAFNTFK